MKKSNKTFIRILAIILAVLCVGGAITLTISLFASMFTSSALIALPALVPLA